MFADLIPARGPGRLVVLTLLINSLGMGVYLAVGVLYFTRVASFSAITVGAMLSIGGVLALAASSPLGYLADRFGPRRLAINLCLLEAIAMAGLIFVLSPWQLAAVSALSLAGQQASRTCVTSSWGGSAGNTKSACGLRDGPPRTLVWPSVARSRVESCSLPQARRTCSY